MDALISSVVVGVVLKAAQISLGTMQKRYSCQRWTWLRPQMVLMSIMNELVACLSFAAASFTWWLNKSFLLKCMPSHLTVFFQY